MNLESIDPKNADTSKVDIYKTPIACRNCERLQTNKTSAPWCKAANELAATWEPHCKIKNNGWSALVSRPCPKCKTIITSGAAPNKFVCPVCGYGLKIEQA